MPFDWQRHSYKLHIRERILLRLVDVLSLEGKPWVQDTWVACSDHTLTRSPHCSVSYGMNHRNV